MAKVSGAITNAASVMVCMKINILIIIHSLLLLF
jgi:hypothetical protein